MYGAWVDLNLEDLSGSPQSLRKYNDASSQPTPPPLRDNPKQNVSPITMVVGVLVLIFLISLIF